MKFGLVILRSLLTIVLFFHAFTSVAENYPAHLLHQPYRIQFYALDSIFQRIVKLDSAGAGKELDLLAEWAQKAGDRQLQYSFALLKFEYSYKYNSNGNSFLETKLPPFIDELRGHHLPLVEARALNDLAAYYWGHRTMFGPAFEYSIKSFNIYAEYSARDFPPKSQYLYWLGLDYYRFKDYQSAIYYLRQAKDTRPLYSDPHYFNILNTIGLCYRQLGVYDSAEHFFQDAHSLVLAEKVPVWAGIIGGNLGITYYLERKFTDAIPLLEEDISAGVKVNRLSENAARSMAYLGDCYLQMNNRTKGLELLEQSFAMAREANRLTNYELMEVLYPRLAKAYAMNGNYKLAYDFSDSARRVSDSISIQKNALVLTSAKERANIEKRKAEEQAQAKEATIQKLVTGFYTVSTILLLIAIFFIYNNYRNQKITNALLEGEKKRSEDLLLNILPPEVAEELKDSGVAAAKLFDDVTVMFTDFVNFTQATERLSPQMLIDELHTCFKAFDEIIERYNIEKIKTIGDAYLAVSGLPIPEAEHAGHVVMAAIEIRDFMQRRASEVGENAFQIRIGVHSGSVVAGIVGVKKFAYDIWGDTVNTAARMEQSSEAGKINISQTTYELVHDRFDCTYRGAIEAKHKGELSMYFVERKDALH